MHGTHRHLVGLFSLCDGELAVNGVAMLSEVPENVTFTGFDDVPHASNAPSSLVEQVQSRSRKGGFLGFSLPMASPLPATCIGKFAGRRFLSAFRFKTWWTTTWVGTSGSDLQMETQWVLFEVPELSSFVLLLPHLEGKFRSAVFPGDGGRVVLRGESGCSRVQAASFKALAYVHADENQREAYAAARVHLSTFRLREEKPISPIADKFGRCTWGAFYLTVDPIGVWHGVKDFADGGIPLRFLVIDNGWKSINLDGEHPNEDAKNLVFGGEQMTGRLHRLDEGEKFRRYKSGSFIFSEKCFYNEDKPKVFSKAKELKIAKKSGNRARELELKRQIDQIFDQKFELLAEENEISAQGGGLKGFIRDLKATFKGLEDIYLWQSLTGAWDGVRPGSTHLDSKLVPVTLSSGLTDTMPDLTVRRPTRDKPASSTIPCTPTSPALESPASKWTSST